MIWQKITVFDDLTAELSLLRVTASVSLFCLNCTQVNEDLMSRSKKIRDRLVEFEVNENREINKKFVFVAFFHTARSLGKYFYIVLVSYIIMLVY